MKLHLVHFNGLVLLAANLSSRRGKAFTLKLIPMKALRPYFDEEARHKSGIKEQ
jgi:hypothetical protein